MKSKKKTSRQKSNKSNKTRKYVIKTRGDAVAMRRDFVNQLNASAYSMSQIKEILEQGKEKEGDNLQGKYHLMLQGVNDIYSTLNKDLDIIRKELKKQFFSKDGEKIKQDFINTNLVIMNKAIQAKDFSNAIEASTLIAKARGVDINKQENQLGTPDNPISLIINGMKLPEKN